MLIILLIWEWFSFKIRFFFIFKIEYTKFVFFISKMVLLIKQSVCYSALIVSYAYDVLSKKVY